MYKLKEQIRLLRYKIKAISQFYKDYIDHIRYFSYYHSQSKMTKEMFHCRIMLLNHQLEKAQTYPNPKKGYGKEKIQDLISLVGKYINKYGIDEVIETSIGVMNSHFTNPYAFSSQSLIQNFKDLQNIISLKKTEESGLGGIVKVNVSEINSISNLYEFLKNRRSCRQFSTSLIDHEDIKDAVLYAMTAPSACNRQCVRVHYYDDHNKIKEIIESQKSDVGWCLGATGMFVITAIKSVFRDYLERNQKMFDAGLFSMLLVVGLHNQKIGACFKMAQKDWDIENETHKKADISDEEDICVLLLIGKYPDDDIICAKSSRILPTTVLKIHDPV